MSKKIAYLLVVLITFLPVHLQAQSWGKASYYNSKLHGRKMASGELYHRDSMTCAHRTLPFGTKLRVRNLDNGKEVVVTVQDRGPHIKGRIIDLSKQAARELGMIGDGIINVQVMRDSPIRIPFLAYDSIPQFNFNKSKVKKPKLDIHTLEALIRGKKTDGNNQLTY